MFFRRYFHFILIGIVLFFWACSANESRIIQKKTHIESSVILISLDGFRWDYLEKVNTPNLDNLIANGVKAKALIPAFPTKTFPNHYTIVTGLYPENHGIIANTMYDPQFNSTFSLGDRSSVEDGRWWGGEPIWVTAEKQGQVSATLFWPGSEAPIKDIRPTYWEKYDGKLAYNKRVQKVLDWLDLPIEKRPTFIALYFDEPDSQGHKYSPNSKEVRDAVSKVDTTLGWLLEALKQREILEKVNIIVTSDHGMTTISPERVIFLDDYIDLNTVEIIDWSPVLALSSRDGKNEKVYNALANAHPQLNVYYKEDIPERLHFRNHRRITPIIGIANEGWSISSHGLLNSLKSKLLGGSHGYDNQLSSMHGIFVASGPAFKKGLIVEPFENIHIYNLIAKILDLKPASNDGNLDTVQIMLEP